ncbi:MAG: LacI family DNA-binding transcriptional regulator [Bacteroidota bacterium]
MATLLTLSPSTVSKALSDSTEISEPTKQRVKDLAKACGYVPNKMARNLKLGRTRSIGVVIPNVVDEFFGMVLQGIEKEASKNNYSVVICISDDKSRKEEMGLAALINGSVDGILISAAKESQRKQRFEYLRNIMLQYGIPVVQFDRVYDELDSDKVCIDDFDGAYIATKHLIETGCKRIAFLSPIFETSVGKKRKNGYLHALQLENGSYIPILLNIKNYEGFEGLVGQAVQYHQIDGILAADELSGVYAMNIIHSLGLKVPNDVSVIGFTNGKMAQCANPPLTTVSQRASDIGKFAIGTLINRIEDDSGELPKEKVLKTKLLIRKSTKSSVN